jgi:hypothetical protein
LERIAKVGIGALLSAILALAGTAWAELSITATGLWSETIDEADLASDPGSDLTSTYESPTDQVSLDITGAVDDLDAWRVDVTRFDATWHANLHLDLRRTSDGSGSGSISGGSSYQEVSETYQSLFSGSGDRTSINIQLRLTGVSVQVPSATYSTTVHYTIVDN